MGSVGNQVLQTLAETRSDHLARWNFWKVKDFNYKSHKNDQLPCSTGTPSISSVTLKIPLLPGVTTTSSPRKGADFQWFWHCGFELTSVPALVLRHCNGLNIQSQEPLAALALIPLQVRLARVNQTCLLVGNSTWWEDKSLQYHDVG